MTERMTELDESRSIATVYGYPRQGRHRQLKRLTESYWAGTASAADLLRGAEQLRAERWREMAAAGLGELPSNDFSLYDHMLDTMVLLRCRPSRFVLDPSDGSAQQRLEAYFALARGNESVAPLEMTKWFDTNYHYLVPELGPEQQFRLDASKPVAEFEEALALGHRTRPVILGPISFLLLSRSTVDGFEPLALVDRLLPVYTQLLGQLSEAGAEWVQIDEPCLVMDQPPAVLSACDRTYRALASSARRPKILIASYFDRLGDALPLLAGLPIDGLAMDFTGRAAANLPGLAQAGGLRNKRLIAGVVDGRNVWRTNLESALGVLGTLLGLTDRLDVAASCSLLHVPLDASLERDIEPRIARWLAFAVQKLDELSTLAAGLVDGPSSIAGQLQVNRTWLAARDASPIVRNEAVRARLHDLSPEEFKRSEPYAERVIEQRRRLRLPALPTTTIGSFPQTPELRSARADLMAGRLDATQYQDVMLREITRVIGLQEDLGLDVLVHGEPERNDMVQYFAEQLDGYLATMHGWVQSYGSRYVRPPILVGDVSRPAPMTVGWTQFATSLTERPVKGMLTGPVTMLAWSFVRDDQPLADTARQVALALRDEVADLQDAGVAVIQVDEPALREALPLRRADRKAYLDWAVESFSLATSVARTDTQIHTHMCYAEFGDVLDAIIAMDADVISLEAARSDMRIVGDLARASYPRECGPGVWDIHSPRVPSTSEIRERLAEIVRVFPADRVWVNPDCGLKTRGYEEVEASLRHLVEAATQARTAIS